MDNYEEKLQQILEHAVKALYYTVITDKDGRILFLSKNYSEMLEVDIEKAIGKPVKDIIINSEIPRVLETGKEEVGHLFTLANGCTVVCNRIPIMNNGELLGVISTATFHNLNSISKLNQQIIQLQKENLKYKKKLMELEKKQKYSTDQIIGSSSKIKEIKSLTERFAASDLPILITGETGTGKEVFANGIYQLSNRAGEPFVKINCAAIPKDLLESELFGYESGAFSGASKKGKVGKLELANHGTVLLDEIGEMPMNLQVKLLRVLQEKEVERLGGIKTIQLDVRFICCTNQNIEEQVEKGIFRRDLYYRINVVELNIPPLRERMDDLSQLCEYFIEKINQTYGLGIIDIDEDVLALFKANVWKGNVRELEHTLERGCVMAGWGTLRREHFNFLADKMKERSLEDEVKESGQIPLGELTANIEKERIIQALVEAGGNKSAAAKLLHIDRSVLYMKLKRYNIPY